MKIKKKIGQEEMVGFALIVVIVAVIMLIFLGFAVKNKGDSETQSYEVESFLQALLQYTTDCEDYSGYVSIKELVSDCNRERNCLDGRDSCVVLEENLERLIAESWKIQGDRPVKAYFLNITSNIGDILIISEGNSTKNSKSAIQPLPPRSGISTDIIFIVYY